jgi:hypothetical protein
MLGACFGRLLPAVILARRLDSHKVRAVVLLDWLVYGGLQL